MQEKLWDVVGLGLNAVDHLCLVPDFPVPGTKSAMTEFTRQGGGQAATAMVCLARLGMRVSYLGKAGDDEMGQYSRASLASEGVDVSGMREVPGETSQFAFIIVPQTTGERTILWRRGSGLVFEDDAFPRERVLGGRLLHLDSHEVPFAIVAARWARESGVPVLLDAERVRPRTEELIQVCDVLLSDSKFGRDMTGETDPKAVLTRLQAMSGARIVGLTEGDQGAYALWEGELFHAPAYRVPVVDTTGAGDVWHAAFGYGLLHEWEPVRVLRFANAVAGLKCRRLGGRAGLPRPGEVEALMEEAIFPQLAEIRPADLPLTALVEDAWYFAREAHREQTRDEGTPYFLHPHRVARVLADELGVRDETSLAVALLHDTLEDVPVDRAYFRQRFGERVGEWVEILTKGPPGYMERLAAAPPEVVRIKMADRIDNVRGLSRSSVRGKREKYLQETREHYLPLSERAGSAARTLLEDTLSTA
ncbi:MAG: carbohydrate kinase family protein [Candidatus Xenobia bacterium]